DQHVRVAPAVARRPPTPPRFPYTPLFRSANRCLPPSYCLTASLRVHAGFRLRRLELGHGAELRAVGEQLVVPPRGHDAATLEQVDRKSTRLNSSHVKISYAVFCLKKKMEV